MNEDFLCITLSIAAVGGLAIIASLPVKIGLFLNGINLEVVDNILIFGMSLIIIGLVLSTYIIKN